MGGGATAWDGLAYDPQANLIYFGTGNGGPWPEALRGSKGKDNLYVCSIIALNPDNGEMKWYYQAVPGDSWDFDSVQQLTLADITIAGRARKVIMAFTASTHPSNRSKMEELIESGDVDSELVPQGSLAERIRAGGAGIPAFYTPAGVGTQTAEGKEHREFNGRMYVMEHALNADYAFVRAKKCDEFGNLVFQGSERNFNPIMAMAARTTIVEVEEVVPIGSIDPSQVHTSGIYVQRIVQIPPDGIFHVARVGPNTPAV